MPTPDSDEGKSEMDKILKELENEEVPEESSIPKKNEGLKQEKAKQELEDDDFGADNMEEYEALADADKENYGI